MKITLKSLRLLNFKGIRDLTINFDGETNIYGDNATGKTTIFDGFTWLLFDKNSADAKVFNIKTLDENNQAIPQIPHEVEGVLDVDGKKITLKKCFNETWQRIKGAETPTFTGHETLYYVNDVPCKQSEYKAEIASIIEEGLFKLITNAMYFNGLKWEDRRAILTSIAGELTDEDVAGTRKDFLALLESMSGKGIAKYRMEIAAKKKKLKDDLLTLPARIDEIKRSIPAPVDYDEINKLINDKNVAIAEIETLIQDQTKAHQKMIELKQGKQNDIFALKTRMNEIEHELKNSMITATNTEDSLKSELLQKLASINRQIDAAENEIEAIFISNSKHEIRATELREEWTKQNASTFTVDHDSDKCPTCQREFDADVLQASHDDLLKRFNENKAKRMSEIRTSGEGIKELITANNARLESWKTSVDNLGDTKAEIEDALAAIKPKESVVPVSLDQLLETNKEYQYLLVQISNKQLEIEEIKPMDVSELRSRESAIREDLNELMAQLAVKETIERAEARKQELMETEKTLSQELADLEKSEFVMDDFSRTKINLIEGRINGMFSLVRFKLFNVLINGAVEPCCDTLLNGIPWNDQNSAGQMQSGVDIINTLSEFHNVFGVIFLDNRESCNSIPTSKIKRHP